MQMCPGRASAPSMPQSSTPTRVETSTGWVAEAAQVLDAALAGFGPTMRRHRCTALIDRAEVSLAMGTVDGACADASEALEISADTQHVESLRRVEKLSRAA